MLTDKDKHLSDNLMRGLSKGKFHDLSAEEIQAFSLAMDWLIRLTRDGDKVYFDEKPPEAPKEEIKENGKDNSTGPKLDSDSKSATTNDSKSKKRGTGTASNDPGTGSAPGGVRKIRDGTRGKGRAKKSRK